MKITKNIKGNAMETFEVISSILRFRKRYLFSGSLFDLILLVYLNFALHSRFTVFKLIEKFFLSKEINN